MMDDRRNRIEESQRPRARHLGDRSGEGRGGQRPRRDDRRPLGQDIDSFADQLDPRVHLNDPRDLGRKQFAIDRQRRSSRNPVQIRRAHHQTAERAHFLVEQAHRILVAIVRAKTVRADHFGQPVGLMRWRSITPVRKIGSPHFGQAHAKSRLGQLKRRFGSGEPAADDVNIVGHCSPYPLGPIQVERRLHAGRGAAPYNR